MILWLREVAIYKEGMYRKEIAEYVTWDNLSVALVSAEVASEKALAAMENEEVNTPEIVSILRGLIGQARVTAGGSTG